MSFEFFFYDWISIDGSYNFFIDLLINLVLSSENQQRKNDEKPISKLTSWSIYFIEPFQF